ncbi:protein of unknown function [Flavobacterium glycines]|uniref:DUF4844 domain-containing protein n=1 Tax=Flavobacterium glycines TaxID=551990 RepID=A0A1B9DL40_9FLAO|nr:DUF4844 domain-containing protein [Flavobacterium glycines]OCB70414.1 hypothetical protein FBGL_12690 [Flavobacterium glycines]GEL11538.1 hypothetical protein FGL01_22770 [Flavobacterium glycines]SDK09949.1 protein of unknown function [Flavobacterium glycines]
MTTSKIDKLKYLLVKEKFADSEWDKRGLIPSNLELCEHLENNLNDCINSLLNQTEKETPKKIKRILIQNMKSLNKSELDTEEKEFVCDYYHEISKIVEVDFKNELNKWLYGSILNSFIKISEFIKGKEKIIEITSQNCTKCNSKLETFILEKDENIPDSDFLIVKCKSCAEFNLIVNGPKIKRLRFGEYDLTEQLSRKDFDLEEAKTRLKQIQYFRK